MNKKVNTYHLYKLDKKNKILTKLDSLELKSERKDIQDIFENNLNEFFPKLEFLKSEHSFAVSQNRVDSIAFHDRENTFFIIEYKTLKGGRGGKIKNQALNYLNELRENSDERFDLVDFWNKEKGRQKWLNRRNINWEKAKVICISEFFHPHESSDKETILIKIEKFGNDILYLEGRAEQLESLGIKKNTTKNKEQAEKENLNESGSKKQITSLPVEKIDIEKFLLERGIKEPKIKQLILEINNFLKSYSLEVMLFTGASSKSSWYIKYSRNKNAVLSLVPQQKFINIYLNKLVDNDLSLKIIKKYELKDYRNTGHNGDLGNDWQYIVNDDNSFQQVFDLLTSYCEKVINKLL
ncbi:MAG: hypothetical protein I3273_06150 [Candidatus Moeniiplasma glomeromycotorum]|nr:hypothetical protein [Candidatus Moeniiplasma glomeromycotorum]MCE8168125.1 hypothetical protein [Candidatus Moeniiplasma glomeromycotorum]MCE8169667.1 hypothetical protein [Candidatus Moeniiplasma glomeromycotorum]